MTPDEFGAKIKAKYPDYASVDNAELSRRIVAKHPEYASQVEFKDAVAQPSTDNITPMGAAMQAISETMTEDVPYLGRVAKAVREDIPGYIAEKSGQLGIPKIGATVGTAIGTAGELIPQKGWELAALGAAKPLAAAGKAVGAAVAPPLISFLTRIEPPVVARAISRVGQIGRKELLAPEIIENAIGALKIGVKDARSALGRKLGAIEDAVAAKMPDRSIPVTDIGSSVGGKFQRLGYLGGGKDVQRGLPKEVSEIVDDFKNIGGGVAAKTSTIADALGRPIITPEVKAQPRSMTFRDALNLRQKIDNVVQWGEEGKIKIDSQTDALLKQGRYDLNERLKAVSDTFRKANDAFAKVAKDYDKLSSDVLSGKDETVQRRITNLFNKDSIERKVLARIDIGAKDAHNSLDTILDAITAQKFRPKLNPVVERAAFHSGGGIIGASGIGGAAGIMGAMGNPIPAALTAGALAATSPRLHSLGIKAFASPIGKGAIPGLSRGSAAAALAALRSQRQK